MEALELERLDGGDAEAAKPGPRVVKVRRAVGQAQAGQIERDAPHAAPRELIEHLAIEEGGGRHAMQAEHRLAGAGLAHKALHARRGEAPPRGAVTLDDLGGAHARRACQTRAGMMSAVATPEQLPAEQRVRLQRAHERLRTASQELQSLVATDPVKNRWAPEPAPATILEAAHSELEAAYAALTRCHAQILARAAGTLDVVDKNQALSFSFADLMRHHGPVSPGGVAHAFKVMQRAFPLLEPAGPIERRAVGVATAFGGPGARDGFEAVTRAVTGERYVFDPELA